MKQVSLSESELRRRRAWLARLAEEHPGQSATDPDLPAEIRAAFSLSEEAGAAFYGSLSDEDLLDVLRRRAEELAAPPPRRRSTGFGAPTCASASVSGPTPSPRRD